MNTNEERRVKENRGQGICSGGVVVEKTKKRAALSFIIDITMLTAQLVTSVIARRLSSCSKTKNDLHLNHVY